MYALCAGFGTRDCSGTSLTIFDNIPNPTNPFRRGSVAHPVEYLSTGYGLRFSPTVFGNLQELQEQVI